MKRNHDDIENDSEREDNYSDVSLDEEDEELIWRVFYSRLEKNGYSLKDSPEDYYEENDSSSEEEGDDEDEEISDISDIDDPELVAKYRDLKEKKIDKTLDEEQKKRLLIANFTDEQMERFESYRRMTVNKPGVKKICNGVLGHSIPQNIAVVLAGISKSLLGEVISRALELQERDHKAKLILDIDFKKRQKREILDSLDRGQEIEVDDRRLQYEGDKVKPLQPNHIREAWRLYRLENSSVPSSQWRRQGDADGKIFR
ncbi:transcription initiation factor TFIID subunit 11 [Scheffersomyces xylosifermentans]|uniref:transcription initiation factor TFIID subunit 11 n=1 Tax=Scheffersomyces xylosifermentans TaxID=1304137 RepID=UPI00315D9F71